MWGCGAREPAALPEHCTVWFWRREEGHSNLSAKDFGKGRRWGGVFRLGGVGKIQRRSVLKRMWDKRREKGRKVEEEYLSNSQLAFVFTICLSICIFFLFLWPYLIHVRMPERSKAFEHGHSFWHSRSGLMTLVVGLLHRATFLSNLILGIYVSFSYMNLVVGKDTY